MSLSDSARLVSSWGDLVAQLVGAVPGLFAFEQRGLRQIFPPLFDRDFGLGLPVRLRRAQLRDGARHFLLIGDYRRGAGARVDDGLLHLHDGQLDHLRGILGTIDKVGQVWPWQCRSSAKKCSSSSSPVHPEAQLLRQPLRKVESAGSRQATRRRRHRIGPSR